MSFRFLVRLVFSYGIVFLASAISTSFAAPEVLSKMPRPLASVINFGEDFTRPLARFDVRLKYQDKGDGSDALVNTYRVDYPLLLRNGWNIATRVDLPMISNDTQGPDNREGRWGLGLGDTLTQVIVASPEANRFRYGTGLRAIWPSATEQQFGSGKYQLAPMVGAVYAPSCLAEGSFVKFIWREEFSVGGDAGRTDIHRSVLNPGASFTLPRQFYADLSPEIKINWQDNAKWFVPFNLTVGKKFGKKLIVSLEWNQALVKQYRPYDWELEARVGYFF